MPRQIDSDAEINSIRIKEQSSAPATPGSGYGQIYEKSDGKVYLKNDAGIEHNLTSTGTPHTLASHLLVDAGSPTHLDFLMYDSSEGMWTNFPVQLSLNVVDVDTPTNPNNNAIFRYSSASGAWVADNNIILSGNLTVSGTAQFGSTGELIDWSNSGTIIGWSSFDAKQIKYTKSGKSVTIFFILRGTSNSTGTSFTLPYISANSSVPYSISIPAADNGSSLIGRGTVAANSNVFVIYPSYWGSLWTASGDKWVEGQFLFMIP